MGAFPILSELLQYAMSYIALELMKICKLSHNEVTNEWNFTKPNNFVLLWNASAHIVSVVHDLLPLI